MFEDLQDFVTCYNASNKLERKESERFHAFSYDKLMERDKVNLDITWIPDKSLEDSDNLPDPDVIALEIAENLEDALEQFSGIVGSLKEGR
jgi:type I restriction enzyme M protein